MEAASNSASTVLNLLRSAPSYWYLATPYSNFPDGHDTAWEAACRIRGELMQYGVCCYSPIAETHEQIRTGPASWVENDDSFVGEAATTFKLLTQ
jgi:hypothetical protein